MSEEGDNIHVVIRNPKLVPPEELRSAAGSTSGAGVQPGSDDEVSDEDVKRGWTVMARLVIGWHVYDATSTEEDQPLLPLPATPELVAKLPLEIINRLGEELAKANPQASPEGSTGNQS